MAHERRRRRSVPAGRCDDASSPAALPESVALSAPTGPDDSGLLAQVDALARMTVELNLRAVGAQAERLEQELKELVVYTGQDKEFRRQHEQRVMDIWREIVAVKTHMDNVRRGHDDMSVALDRCRRETSDLRRHVTREMSSLRHLVDALTSQLNALASPPLDGAHADLGGNLWDRGSQPRAPMLQPLLRRRLPGPRPATPAGPRSGASRKPSARRAAGTVTTRRQASPTRGFVANYLKQKSKRDPPMAVFIQQAIQKHVQRGHRPHAVARPRSLDDFCRDITWADVTDTVEHALINKAAEAIKALRRLPWPAPA